MSVACLQAIALQAAGKSQIRNGAVSTEETHTNAVPQGSARVYLNGRTNQLSDLEIGTWSVKPGMSPHDIHQHAEEELLIFVEGTGEIIISGSKQAVKPGSVMYCAANTPHGVFNGPNSEMLFYFVKWRA